MKKYEDKFIKSLQTPAPFPAIVIDLKNQQQPPINQNKSSTSRQHLKSVSLSIDLKSITIISKLN